VGCGADAGTIPSAAFLRVPDQRRTIVGLTSRRERGQAAGPMMLRRFRDTGPRARGSTQRAGEYGACTRLTARGEQIAGEHRATNLELVAMWLCHDTLSPVDRTAGAQARQGNPPLHKERSGVLLLFQSRRP
jgi:hypothetical protein